MGSLEQSKIRRTTMPFLAIFQADLEALLRSRITYGWLITGVFLQVIRVLSNSRITPISVIIPLGLNDFIIIWSMLIIGTTASTVSSETGELADSIMSKSVKRQDYIFAKFASRIVYVTIMYLAITLVLVIASLRLAENDYDVYGLVAAIIFVLIALIMLTSLGVSLSAFVSNSVIAIVTLLILWYSMTAFFPLLDMELLSPSNLIAKMPDLIQGDWTGDSWITAVIFGYISVVFTFLTASYFTTKDL